MADVGDCDVAVVGAGLAGLACAAQLTAAGHDVHVWEAGDAVGGRVRTDRVDGFLMDRGFQVLSTAYPEARRVLDYGRLDLRPFDRAMALHVDGATVRLADPLREPPAALTAARAPVGGLRDKVALGAYAGLSGGLTSRRLRSRRDVSAAEAWRSHGLGDAPVDRLLRPFFAGVLLEHDMSTSRRFVDLMTRMFVRGQSALPSYGMQAIPEQLAEALPESHLRLSAPVREVTPRTLHTDDGQVRARAVVVATDADAAARLFSGGPSEMTTPSWKGVTTMYHAAPEPPMRTATLLVDADRSPVNNTVVVTEAAPSYSVDGRALVATSLVHGAGAEDADEPTVRARLATLYGVGTTDWELVATYVVPRSLPAMPAPHSFRKPVRLGRAGDVVYVCGDHRDTSSIQGALVSGRRAADAVLVDFAGEAAA